MTCSLALGVGTELVRDARRVAKRCQRTPRAARTQRTEMHRSPSAAQVPQWGSYNLWPATPGMSPVVQGLNTAVSLILSTSFCLAAITAIVLNLIMPAELPEGEVRSALVRELFPARSKTATLPSPPHLVVQADRRWRSRT